MTNAQSNGLVNLDQSSSNSNSPSNSNDLINTFHFKSTNCHNIQNKVDSTNKRSTKQTSTENTTTNTYNSSDSRTRDKNGGTNHRTRKSKGSKKLKHYKET